MKFLKRIRLMVLVMLVSIAMPVLAVAQSVGDQLDGMVDSIPYGGVIFGLVLAIFGVANAFVSDDKIPSWLRPVWTFLTTAYLKGKNDPSAQSGGTPPTA